MADVTFEPGSFFDNVDKFANSLGYQNAGIAIELAMIPWKSPEDRDAFIVGITEEDVKGGTEKNYIKRNFQGVKMSSWNSFLSTTGSVLKKLTGGGSYLSEDEQKREEAFTANVRNALDSVNKSIESTAPGRVAKAASKATADFLLKGAVQFNEKVYSPLISRPISTLALLTDSKSPLYKKGQFEEGFQFEDIKRAYNRSEKVSAMQALTKSDLLPIINPLSQLVLSSGKIDLNTVNLWNDESIKSNFVDNAVGRWYTGIGDLLVGNKGIGVAGKIAGVGVKAIAKPAGLYTKGKSVDALATDMENGILHANTNGAQGAQTVTGSHVLLLAGTKDWGIIEDLVTKYSTNEKLIPIIRETSDAGVVKDILLADKGNLPALERLAATSSDKLFDMADVKSQIRNKAIQDGQLPLPTGESALRLRKAFDDAINNDPQFKKIRDAFFNEKGDLTYGAKEFMPIEPTIGAAALIKGQGVVRNVKSAIRGREYEKISGFLETTIGTTAGGLVMRGVRLAGRATDSLPGGFVSLSGMRPMQARVELTGFLNNMKMFRDGAAKVETQPGLFEKVSVVRARLEDEYMNTLGKGSIAQVEALKSIDAQVGRMLAYKAKIYDETAINTYVAKFQMNVSKGMQSVKENGFGIGYDGNVTLVEPQTLRQFAESYRFTPWDDIETQLDIEAAKGFVKGAKAGNRAGRDIFGELNKVWTFDVLARPSYAFKQSLFEPIISVGLSQGIAFVRDEIIAAGAKRASKNFYNWSVDNVKKRVINRAEYKAVVSNVSDRSQMLQQAIAAKNYAEASVDDLLKNASPATKSQHLSAARKELKVIQEIVDGIELDLRDAMVPYGITEAVPSMATLERRIAYLEANPGITKKTAEVKKAKAAVANYKNIVGKMATNKKVIVDADNAVQQAYASIDNAIKALGEARVKQADVFGKSAKFKERYYSKEKHTIVLNGTQHHIDSFIEEQADGSANNFTAAVRAETQNARTQQINFLGEMSVASGVAAIKRKIPMSKIGVGDPNYFEELADIANRQYRGEPLMDLIFAETPVEGILKWGKSAEGTAYLKAFGIVDEKVVPTYLLEKVELVKRMYPSYEARAAILKGEVTSQQLEKFLAPYAEKLYDIIPSNHNYEALTFGVSGVATATQGYNKMMTKVMSRLASVENPIRGALFDKLATENVARRAQYLMDQGIEMTTTQYNALRQGAGREALQEMEKTLYTINNPNRLINSLRGVIAFPGANANAFLRYGRLAAKNPVRAAGVISNYGRAYTTFSVDEYGNPTNDINKMSHLIVPGTKELGLGSRGEGVKLSTQSLGFLLNRPGPSFITSISIGQTMQKFHKSEAEVESLMTWGGTNWYKVLFPYGPPTSVRDAYTPPWLKNAINGFAYEGWQRELAGKIFGQSGQRDYLSSWKSVYNYNAMLVEMGIQKDMPSDAEIEKQVKGLFRAKFISTFASPYAGIPYKIDNAPMALTSNLYYKLQEKYIAQGMANQDARDAAGEEMLALLGPQFMLDRVTFTGSSKNLNIPATSEAYARVFEDNNDLVGRLANIEPGEIGLVGLLTADLDYDPAKQSNNILTLLANPSATLPGTSKNLNELKMTPQEIETERLKQRTWNTYMAAKAALEAKITDGKTLRAHPELKAVLDNLASTVFKEQSQAWYDQYQLAQSGDTSYKYARALTEIVNDKKFMAKNGKSQLWLDTQEFLNARSMFSAAYQMLPDYDPRKAMLRDAYNMWTEQNLGQWDSNLKTIITRYFDNDSLKAAN